MYVLVLAESSISASFISNGLKYENILSEPKIFNYDVINEFSINKYDCIIVKTPVSPTLTSEYLKTLSEIQFKKPIFILINREYFLLNNSIEIPSKYIYPFNISMRFLSMELKKHIKPRLIKNGSNTLKVYDLELNLNNREAKRFNRTLFLRNKEFQLLEYLMRNTNYLLSRQMLLENVWDRNAHIMTNTVDVHINCLRRKIDHKADYKLIETIYCNGYIMHTKPFCNN